MNKTKPFEIPKELVWEAYKRVKANKGGSGIDEESIKDFEINLKANLYKLWNRLSSGSYFPPAVKMVAIPKKNGEKRCLGIPTVGDRIAQTVVKLVLEPKIEPCFHSDSYGYRPGKSALEAVGITRKRCWRYNWVIDMDIKGFFDNLNHDLLLRAVKKHTDSKWVLLYLDRWLTALLETEEGNLITRNQGTPQGSVISPLLANVFLHYGFDEWMKRNHPDNPFARYADDSVVHCQTEQEAVVLKGLIEYRLKECGLELHPSKTKIIYCKDDDREGEYLNTKFDFLGYTFRSRRSKNKWGKHFINFTPGISNQAKKAIRTKIRGWALHNKSDKSMEDLANMFNPMIRGWINYYGRYYKSALYPVFRHLNWVLSRWVSRKYKKFSRHMRRARHLLGEIARKKPTLFSHWQFGIKPEVRH